MTNVQKPQVQTINCRNLDRIPSHLALERQLKLAPDNWPNQTLLTGLFVTQPFPPVYEMRGGTPCFDAFLSTGLYRKDEQFRLDLTPLIEISFAGTAPTSWSAELASGTIEWLNVRAAIVEKFFTDVARNAGQITDVLQSFNHLSDLVKQKNAAVMGSREHSVLVGKVVDRILECNVLFEESIMAYTMSLSRDEVANFQLGVSTPLDCFGKPIARTSSVELVIPSGTIFDLN